MEKNKKVNWGYPSSSAVKNLPAVLETQVWSLDWEDSLEEAMAICSSILVWKIPWTEKTNGLQSTGSQRVEHNWCECAYKKLYYSISPGKNLLSRSALFNVVATTYSSYWACEMWLVQNCGLWSTGKHRSLNVPLIIFIWFIYIDGYMLKR